MSTNPITGKEELAQLNTENALGAPRVLDLSLLGAGSIPTAALIGDAGITAAMIAAGAVTAAKLSVPAAGAGNGGVLGAALRVAVVRYNFGVDGGATPITPAINVTLPAGAVVLGGAVHVDPAGAVTAVGGATVAIGTSAGSGTASILAGTGKASLGNDAVVVATAAATPFVMTAAGTVVLTIATGPLTAGIIDIFIVYAVGVSAT